MKDIRIAAAIFSAPSSEIDSNLNHMHQMVQSAGGQGARIICFPEMNITGYSSGADIRQVAEPIPGEITRRITQMAAEEGILILAGMAEKGRDGQIFATHLVAHPDGKLAHYRKIHCAPPERSTYTPGETVPLFNYDGIRFGIQLCYDAHFPELSTLMAQHGADVIFMPHASPKGTPHEKYRSWKRHLPARAFDNSLFIVACNQNGQNRKGLKFPGIALAIDPSGQTITKNLSGRDDLLVADLAATALERVRGHQMRFFFPNRRPNLYQRAPITSSE